MELKSVTIERTVEKQHFASAMKSGSLDVLATPQLVAWMEEAACLCLDLEPGMTSVGISVKVSHDKASKLGAKITIHAEMSEIDDRKIKFQLIAMDNGEVIGRGYHERFLVDAKRFMEKLG